MRCFSRTAGITVGLAVALGCLAPRDALAQGRGNRPTQQVQVSLTVEMKEQIRGFYASRPESHAEALPPGIRRNLARGKPLPPGIARQKVPADLLMYLHVPEGYQLVEVGVDVFLVEVATAIIHDALMDVIR